MMTSSGDDSLTTGTLAVLHGLQTASHLNGRRGVLCSDLSSSTNGRVEVQLFPKSDKKTVLVKPKNLTSQRQIDSLAEELQFLKADCFHCSTFLLTSDLQQCSKCKLACYCTKQCQKADWKSHKEDCEMMRQARKEIKQGGDVAVRDFCSAAFSSSWPAEVNRAKVKKCGFVLGALIGRLAEQGDQIRAESMLRAGIAALEPYISSHMHVRLCKVISQQTGRIDEAVEIMQHAIRVGSSPDLLLHGHLGILLERQGDFEQAISHLQKAIELNPRECTHLWFRIGRMYNNMGDFGQAEHALLKVIQEVGPVTNSEDKNAALVARAYFNLGCMKAHYPPNGLICRIRAGKNLANLEQEAREIREMYQKAVQLDPTDEPYKEALSNFESPFERYFNWWRHTGKETQT